MQYWFLDDPDKNEHGVTTVDISMKSVLFESNELIGMGTGIRMELNLPSLDREIKASGRINRIEENEVGGCFRYCLLFEEISQKDKKILDKYIQLIDIDNLLKLAVERNASDVHLLSDQPPIFRIDGELVFLDFPPLSSKDLRSMILAMMTEKQRSRFQEKRELNFSCLIPEGRFRVNVHYERGNVEAALRIIPSRIRTFSELGLPPAMDEFARKCSGLLIVTGPTGSGKTTTLATLVDTINQNRKCMIITIEEPIEYAFEGGQSLIKQREVGTDTLSFADGLRNVLRQDPDVILISELEDLESIELALTAAETGHLVLTSMHTTNAVECITRLVDLFPLDKREQIRDRLAGCLVGLVGQILVPKKDGEGRVIATEVLVSTPTIAKLIREGNPEKFATYNEAGLQCGIQPLDDSLKQLVQDGLVEESVARSFAKNPGAIRPATIKL
jgi:twitching motility protein PilT